MIGFPDLSLLQLALCFLVTVFAGFTKGVTGFALPMIMIAGMSNFIDPELAIASIVVPTFVGNFWQAARQGPLASWESFKSHRILILTTLIGIYVFAQVLAGLPLGSMLILLAVMIFVASLVQIIGFRITIRPQFRKIGGFIAGLIAGFFGSISGTWGPPTTIYLLAIDTPKAEQTRTMGITFGLGALVFWLAHQRSGLITPSALGLSVFLLIPMFIGLALGVRAQDRIDQATFRKATLWVLLIASLNIFRKALAL